MPIYEYQCTACDDRFERFHRMTDPAITECPECGGLVRKVLHPPAISFKGPGFYVNDYGRKTPPPAPAAEAPAKPAETATTAPATPPAPSKAA